tara:strand:+ start:371 stop:514 length:144 start_codon:yes stop_codon:yes gene_type:complete
MQINAGFFVAASCKLQAASCKLQKRKLTVTTVKPLLLLLLLLLLLEA